MSQGFEIIQPAQVIWRDGVPYSPLFDDVYFSSFNGFSEKEHVFIHANHLPLRFAQVPEDACFTIAETGFGTGLNFLATWHYWLQHASSQSKLFYYTTELYPLTREELSKCLKLWPMLDHERQALLNAYPVLTPGIHWLSFEQGRIQLVLMIGDALDCYEQLLESGDPLHEKDCRDWFVDAWFLDGFSPEKNARIWQDKLFYFMSLLSKKGTSFSSSGVDDHVYQALKAHGFDPALVEGDEQKCPMIHGCFSGEGIKKRIPDSLKTPWHRARSHPERRVLIIGGGLAGCFTAHALAKRGYEIQLLEANQHIAQHGSGNQYAILYPKLSAFAAPFTQWMLQAFLYAQRFYKPLVGKAFNGALEGILQFAHHAREQKTQRYLEEMLSYYPDLARFVSSDEASALAGVRILKEALFIPQAGWIHVPQLCDYLVQDPRIEVLCHTPIFDLHYADNLWHAGKYSAPIVVLANAAGLLTFQQTSHVPLKTIRGGLSLMSPHPALADLKLPLCGDGHLMPLIDGVHAVGATYHQSSDLSLDLAAEHHANSQKARNMPLSEPLDLNPQVYWGNIRVSTPDYLPLTGGIASPACFEKQYAKLKKDSKHYIAEMPVVYPGLYVNAGFGSRGLCTIPLTSEYLAGLIHGEPATLSRTLRRALSPQRFLFRDLCRY